MEHGGLDAKLKIETLERLLEGKITEKKREILLKENQFVV